MRITLHDDRKGWRERVITEMDSSELPGILVELDTWLNDKFAAPNNLDITIKVYSGGSGEIMVQSVGYPTHKYPMVLMGDRLMV